VRDLAPWFAVRGLESPVGEVWLTGEDNRTDDGTTLGELCRTHRREVLGSLPTDKPLLLKFIFTSERLSVQVHPDDEYAKVHHNSPGKTEAWYVLDAQPESVLGLGLTQKLTAEQARSAAQDGSIEKLLDWEAVEAGECYFVPAGTVHAIGSDLTVFEVQENSDITYRLYDYGRPRELHLDRGLEVAKLEPYPGSPSRQVLGNDRELLIACPHFHLERRNLTGTLRWSPGEERYLLLTILGGSGTIGGDTVFPGETWLVPAAGNTFEIEGEELEFLVSYEGSKATDSLS
jgi:mannose-6-phosphate isomerase